VFRTDGAQSGYTIDIDGHISICGDGEARTPTYEAASAMLLRAKKRHAVEACGEARGHVRAVVAVARKLAVVMHRMWIDGSAFRFSAQEEPSGSPKRGTKRTLAIASPESIEARINDNMTTN
jgi:transposase